MKKIIKELETRVVRTYKGGKLLDEFLHKADPQDIDKPEDWISSFVSAKNRVLIPNEGITRVLVDGKEQLITDVVSQEDFGQGREDAGVLVKFLDSKERLGIQVHPTKPYARKHFQSDYGKNECWHILDVRPDGGEIFIGFKEGITKEQWEKLFREQNIQGMLDAMHRFDVHAGDTILVTGGTPHAIGEGCLLLEIQEPSDYTMRVEKTTVGGEELTPMQIHYGVGEENMLDCFSYIPRSEDQLKEEFFLKSTREENHEILVSYQDTPCFSLEKIHGGEYSFCRDYFVTVVAYEDGGTICGGEDTFQLTRGDKYFIPAGLAVTLKDAKALICCPPEKA